MERNTIWLVECGEYEQCYVAAAFTTETAAKDYADRNEGRIEEMPLHESPIRAATYWHFGAEVYPDRTVKRWDAEHIGNEGDMPPVDNADRIHELPWDGHSQGHCGFHVSVFGCDRDLTRAARERWVVEYLPLCDGTCPSCGRTENYATNWHDALAV